MEKLQRFQEDRERRHPPDPEPCQKRPRARVASGKGGCVGHRGGLRLIRGTDLQRHDGLSERPRLCRHRLEAAQIVDPLDMEPKCRHTLIPQERAANL